MEGIMMRCPSGYAQVVRAPDGKLQIETKRQPQFGAGNKFLEFPMVRGTVRLADSLIVGTKALFNSAEISASEDDPNYKPSKFDLWVEKKLGNKAMGVIMTLSLILALVIAIGLFFILPRLAVEGLEKIPGVNLPWLVSNIIEGVIRMLIFIGYLALISNMKDIRRVFMYHGAEHKTIFCYEKYEELTVENVRKQSKHHPRCGTAFLFVVMIISILIHSLIPNTGNTFLNILVRILSLPIIAGIAYEFNRYAGKHENRLVKVLRAPGLLMQRFTTKEPDDDMIEVAIVALQEALKLEEMPDYASKTPAVENIDQGDPGAENAGENVDLVVNKAEDQAPGAGAADDAAGTDQYVQPDQTAGPAQNAQTVQTAQAAQTVQTAQTAQTARPVQTSRPGENASSKKGINWNESLFFDRSSGDE